MAKKPRPKNEIHTLICVPSHCLSITVESFDMAERLEREAPEYGVLLPMINPYSIYVRKTFDVVDVGLWLGRDGIVKVAGGEVITKREDYSR